MRKKLARLISGLAAALLIAGSPTPVRASQTNEWNTWGLPESGTGSVTFALTYLEDAAELGEKDRIAIGGIRYDLYQVWSLQANGGVGTVTINKPFDEFLTEEDLLGTDPVVNDLAGAAPSENVRKMAEEMSAATVLSRATAYRTAGTGADQIALSGADGVIQVADLPFGGYLFVPLGKKQTGTIYVGGNNTGTAEFVLPSFLVTTPMRASEIDLSQMESVSVDDFEYIADVVATPKVEHDVNPYDEANFLIAKVDVGGRYVVGAKLQVVSRGEDPTKPTTLRDRLTGELVSWTTTADAQSISLPAGDYTLTELEAPTGYATAEDLNFHVDSLSRVTYFDANWKEVECRAAEDGLTVDANGNCVNGAFDHLVTMVDPIKPPTTPPPSTTPPATVTPPPTTTVPPTTTNNPPVKTGDESRAGLYIGILIAAAAALGILAVILRRRKKEEE